MKMLTIEKYKALFTTAKRYIILMGGRGGGRSTVASQYFLAKLMNEEYFRGAIMRYVLGDIRNSCFREILDRAEEQGVKRMLNINESQMTISIGQNSIHAHGFRKSSGDQKAKLKSLANYNHVWIEEADEVPEEDFMQLDDSLRTVRGNIRVLLTLNPPAKTHWILKRWFKLVSAGVQGFYKAIASHEDVLHIFTDYHDNIKNIDPHTQKRYEEYKQTKPDHYWNMIKGLIPETLKGKIYREWATVPNVPHEARLLGYGLDFGFDPDPASIVALYYYNGGYILDEVLYQTELDNEDLANVLKRQPKGITVADSAEPKSINELRKYGADVYPCVKGADSVRWGIKHVQGLRISVTERSTNILNEYDNYVWKVTKDGDEIGIEDPKCANHAMSAIRYGLTYFVDTDVPVKEPTPVVIPDSKYDGTIPVFQESNVPFTTDELARM
jgi:phage terminase large subunit